MAGWLLDSMHPGGWVLGALEFFQKGWLPLWAGGYGGRGAVLQRLSGGGGRAGKAAQEVPVPVGTWGGPGPLRKGWSRGSEEKGCWGRRGEWWVFIGSTRAREASGGGAGLLDLGPKKAGTTLSCLSHPAQCQAHSRCLIGT